MSTLPQDSNTDETSPESAAPLDANEIELNRQVMAHIREFGTRKYLAFYNQAKKLKEDGIETSKIRQSLVDELPPLPPAPEGGTHLISRIHRAKLQAIYHVVRNAVEDALARRPPLFREEMASDQLRNVALPAKSDLAKP